MYIFSDSSSLKDFHWKMKYYMRFHTGYHFF